MAQQEGSKEKEDEGNQILTGNELGALIWSLEILKEESLCVLSIWSCKRSQCKGHEILLLSSFSILLLS